MDLAIHSHAPPDDASQSHALHKWMLGTALVAGAIVLSPYILPAMGIGSANLAAIAEMGVAHGGIGAGVVGILAKGLGAVPFIGETLAKGGLVSAAVSGVAGIGGVLLGRFIEKKQDGKPGVNWGKVITYGALMTSALVALPSLLTGIGVGLYFLGRLASPAIGSAVLTFLDHYVGAIAMDHAGAGAAAAVLPHVLACGGAALLPAALSFTQGGKKASPPGLFAQQTCIQAANATPVKRYTDGSVIAELEMDSPTAANMPCQAKLRLSDIRTGLPITNDELAITHTRKLHLYVTDQSLKEYYHIHPHPTDEPGVLAFSFTPQTSNQYNAWADFTLMKDGGNHRIKIEIPSAVKRNIPAVIRTNAQAQQDGMVFNWKSSAPLQKDTPAIIEVNVTDAQGNPVTNLEPVMGAFAHLAGFSADGKHFIHTHPLGVEPTSLDARGGPRLRFHVEPDYSGPTQFYLQICRDGQEVHVPFGQQIKPPELNSERIHVNHAAMHFSHGL